MKYLWSLFEFTDPALPMTHGQRLKLTFWPFLRIYLPRGMLKHRIPYALLAGAGITGLYFIIFEYSGLGPGSRILLWLPSLFFWMCLSYGPLCKQEKRYRLRLEGYDVCLKCGYWLRELGDDITKCPECGAERRPMPEPKP